MPVMEVHECPVTGLPNRRGLMLHLERALAAAAHRREPFAVLFCDLNGIREVNTSHGHDAGDELLVEIGRRLRQATRQGDLVARLGGDAFVVVSHHLHRSSQASDIAERLQQAVGQAWTVGSDVLHPSLSIGIAVAETLPGDAHLSAGDLIRRADQAMDAARAANLRDAQFYDDSLAQQRRQTTRILQSLRTALATRSLQLHLQPIVALGSGAVHSHEALVRLPGPDGELLSPDRFIPQAERSRLIGELGQQVLQQALQWLAGSEAEGPPLSIAVNVSPLELADRGFAERVLAACAAAAIDPARLHLEITETAIIAQPSCTAAVLNRLRQAGVRIHLDDFGTGYSSLSLLSELPVDGLKIDRSFTAALGEDRSRTAVIQVITQLCRELGISVIAEGIETEAQQQRLIGLRCDFGQGYLFGRPAPLDGGRRDPR